MRESEIMMLMNAFGAAYSAGDVDGVAACLAEEFTWNLPTGEGAPQGRALQGKEAVKAFLLERFAQKHALVFSDGRREVAGGMVVSRYRVRGTSPDGRRIDAMGLDIYRVAGGKILSKDAYWKQIAWAQTPDQSDAG